jgi:RHS repeat-associated protein
LERESCANARYLIEDREVDAEGQVLTLTDGRGIQHTYQYDTQGRLIEEVAAASEPSVAATTQYEYDPQGNLIRQLHPRHFAEPDSFITRFTYTGRNLLESRTEAVGYPEEATTRYAYYLDKRSETTVDPRGNPWTDIWHSCCERLRGAIDPTGAGDISNTDFYGNITHTAVVEDMSAIVNFHDPVGTLNEVTTEYDARHRPVARTVWLIDLGAVDPNDVPIAGDDGIPETDGLTTRWEYDDNLADGEGIDSTYSADLGVLGLGPGSDGCGVAMTNPEHETSVTIYDGTGRVVMVIDGNGNTTRTEYDTEVSIRGFCNGSVTGDVVETAVVSALGHVSRSRGDGGDRVLQLVDAEDYVTTCQYDNNSNRIQIRDPNDVGVIVRFDDRNRNTTVVDTEDDSTRAVYDVESNVVARIDGVGDSTLCVFDVRDRVISTTSRVKGVTSYAYDCNNNVLTIEDADGGPGVGVTTYEYDSRNLKTRETFDDGGVITYEYDCARRLTSRTDQNSDVVHCVYDRANRLLERQYPDALNDVFTYDGAGRLLTATSSRYENTVTRTYDAGSRLLSEELSQTIPSGTKTHTVGFSYDADNRKTSITYPDGSVVTRDYTARNQLSELALDGTPVEYRIYDPGMRLIASAKGSCPLETRTYFDDNLVHTIRVPGITDFTYMYDSNKRRLTEINGIQNSLTQTYDYDDEDRLDDWSRNDGKTQTWALSKVGDWDTTTVNGIPEVRTHNGIHELIAIDGNALTYDAKGNMTSNATGMICAWDYDNQLSNAGNADYRYDALGRRTRKATDPNGHTEIYVYDGAQAIAEYDTSDTLMRKYLYASYIDDASLMVDSSGAWHYYHRDAIYSTRGVTDATGNLDERYEYTPYGGVSMYNSGGLPISNSGIGNAYFFTGRRLDAETELYFYRARYYEPEFGRFISRDPLWRMDNILGVGVHNAFVMDQFVVAYAIPQAQYLEFNLDRRAFVGEDPGTTTSYEMNGTYHFVGNSPPNNLDPTGLEWRDPAHQPTLLVLHNQSTYGPCGMFTWSVNFKITEKSIRGGYIIQKVHYDIKAFDCITGDPYRPCTGKNTYWEAWLVPAYSTDTATQAEDPIGGLGRRGWSDPDDTFAWYNGCQVLCVEGDIYFQGEAVFVEGLKSLANHGFTPGGVVEAHGLRSTQTVSPPIFNLVGEYNVQNTAAHIIWLTWQCCYSYNDTVKGFKKIKSMRAKIHIPW